MRSAPTAAWMLDVQRTAGNTAAAAVIAQRQARPGALNYARANRENARLAKALGWGKRLAEVKPEWASLWEGSRQNEFADAVAAFQRVQGFTAKQADGVMGSATWARVRPLGEVVAGQAVSWKKSAEVCSVASQERLTKGFRRATGLSLHDTREEKDHFRVILHSIASKMRKVPEQYRGTGAAGAMVYLGHGEFVSETEIWEGRRLRKGAAMQVWGDAEDVARLKKGKEPRYGTSFVFLEYVPGKDAMRVLHFDEVQTKQRSDYGVWIAANLTR